MSNTAIHHNLIPKQDRPSSAKIELALLALLLLLLAPAMPWPCPAQDSESPENAFPRFVRCTQRNDGQIWLHEPIPAGTQVELLPQTGSERFSVTVPENARYIYNSEITGPLSMTRFPLETEPDMGLIPMAVLPPGLPFEDLPLEPLPQGADPVPEATRALAAGPPEAYPRTSLSVSELSARTHLHLEQDGVPLDVVYYETGSGQQIQDWAFPEYLALQTPTSFKALALGCNLHNHAKFKLFRLNNVLYVMTQYRCCECGNEYITVNAFQDGEFVTVYINGDWGN